LDLSKILDQLRSERARIDEAITALEQINGTAARRGRPRLAPGRPRRRRLSPEGRRRLSEMMKKRWAERRRRAKVA
jgi:hypothetical protein